MFGEVEPASNVLYTAFAAPQAVAALGIFFCRGTHDKNSPTSLEVIALKSGAVTFSSLSPRVLLVARLTFVRVTQEAYPLRLSLRKSPSAVTARRALEERTAVEQQRFVAAAIRSSGSDSQQRRGSRATAAARRSSLAISKPVRVGLLSVGVAVLLNG